MPTNTDSLDRLLKTVRASLLAFVPMSHPVGGTATLAARLGTVPGAGSDGKLYITQVPDNTAYPYGVMRWMSGQAAGDDGGFQLRGTIELQLFHYGRKNEPAVSAMMDVVEAAWRDFVATAVGDTIVAQRASGRMVVPYEPPADRELVCVRILLPLYATPAYQAQYSPTSL